MNKRHVGSAILVLVLILGATWVVENSETFQACIDTYKNQPDPHHLKEGITQTRSTFALIKFCAGHFMSENGEVITAFFTLVLAISTSLLWRSTEHLWKAANQQGSDMQASISEAARAATAMEAVAEHIGKSAVAAVESVELTRTRWAQQMRAYITVLIHEGFYQDRATNFKFGVVPAVVNTGHTPAHNVRYRAKAAVLPYPLPPQFNLDLPADTPWVGRSVVGPHQTVTLNTIVDDFVPDAEVENIKFGIGRRVYIWGTVAYEDEFGVSRETDFSQSISWLRDGRILGTYERRSRAT